jgi:hypothetical protein
MKKCIFVLGKEGVILTRILTYTNLAKMKKCIFVLGKEDEGWEKIRDEWQDRHNGRMERISDLSYPAQSAQKCMKFAEAFGLLKTRYYPLTEGNTAKKDQDIPNKCQEVV